MGISIFGYKISLEILILIGVIYLILVGHTLCGCCKYSMMEAFDVANKSINNAIKEVEFKRKNENSPVGTSITTKKNNIEGFSGANTNYGQSSPYDLNNDIPINTSSWNNPNLTVISGQPLNNDVKKFLDREPQPVPLPEDELVMFSSTPFKPECCPNTYSNSSGCACMTGNQYNYLQKRGGNNVPYSEY